MVTLETIAATVGVSKTTVSRVLNYDKSLNIKQSTKDEIFRVAEDLNYTSKKYTKKLKKIFIINNLTSSQEHKDPFFLSMRLNIEKQCMQNNIKFTSIYLDNLESFFQDFELASSDGIVLIGSINEDIVNKISEISLNIISIGKEYEEMSIPAILTDEYKNPLKILTQFYQQGLKSIMYLGPDNYARYTAYSDFCNENNIKELHCFCDFSYEEAMNALEIYLKANNPVDAIFCASDTIAIGAMKALFEANLNTPNNVQICGFNNIASSLYTTPPLTTINVNEELMAELAISTLSKNFNSKNRYAIIQIIPTEIIYRETTNFSQKQ